MLSLNQPRVEPDVPLFPSEFLIDSSINEIENIISHQHNHNNDATTFFNGEPPPPSPAIKPIFSINIPRLQVPNHQQLMYEAQCELEIVCTDLMMKFDHALRHSSANIVYSVIEDDPLNITIQLLAQSMTRLRTFLMELDARNWLSLRDYETLYSRNICSVTIFRASMAIDVGQTPSAYPLPYGDYLEELEALQLIMAHDFYDELRVILRKIKQLRIQDKVIFLIVILITFFSVNDLCVEEPHKIGRIQQYYIRMLKIYISLEFGEENISTILGSVMTTVDMVKNFSLRLRKFISEVTQQGLQNQFESVCENIGLIAFILQTPPPNPLA